MFLALMRFPRSYYFLMLIGANLVSSMPFGPRKRDTMENSGRSGFSEVPKILEIQLPLKIATKEDLVAWAKYVMGLMASKINITLSTVKEPKIRTVENVRATNQTTNPTKDKQVSNMHFPKTRPNEINDEYILNEKARNANLARMREINALRSFEIKGTINDPGSRMRGPNIRNSFRTMDEQKFFLPQYQDFGTRQIYDLNENEIIRDSNPLSPPQGYYLPLPLTNNNINNINNINSRFRENEFSTRYFFERNQGNISANHLGALSFEKPLSATRTFEDKMEGVENLSPIRASVGNFPKNISSAIKPVLTVPFEAVITITREEDEFPLQNEKNINSFAPIRDPPDEFPPYFEKNFTVANESGQINVVLEDTNSTEINKLTEDIPQKEEKKKEKSKKGRTRKDKSRKRQTSALGELLKMLAILRKDNNTSPDVNITPPVLKILKGTSPQKAKIQTENKNTNGGRRNNETSQAQEIEDDDDDDGGDNDDDDYDDDYDEYGEEEQGGSLQALLELLPLVTPILEDLSDPNTETDIREVLDAAIPILEGLSEDDDVDIPGVLVPVLLNSSGGKDGQDDSGAILGPLIQLIAPLIGPIVGPLLGPLSRQSSNAPGEGGSSLGALFKTSFGSLSEPTGPGKMTPISNIIAGVVSTLSKDLASGKSSIDISAIVKQVVSGLIAGTSAGLSGNKDSAVAPTSYGGYGGYGGYGPSNVPANSVNPIGLIGSSIKDVFGAGLKVASSFVTLLSRLFGASSQSQPPQYGPPNNYAPPNNYGPPPTNGDTASSPYKQNTFSPRRQIKPK